MYYGNVIFIRTEMIIISLLFLMLLLIIPITWNPQLYKYIMFYN